MLNGPGEVARVALSSLSAGDVPNQERECAIGRKWLSSLHLRTHVQRARTRDDGGLVVISPRIEQKDAQELHMGPGDSGEGVLGVLLLLVRPGRKEDAVSQTR
jgi:hypothetical protein